MTQSPLVAAFRTLQLLAVDTPAGPLANCPVCDASLHLGDQSATCPKCNWTALGEPWEIAQLARAAVPTKAKRRQLKLDCDADYDSPPALPEELIPGILSAGSKMVLGGGSKSAKTWSLMHLGLALSTGQPWWGYKIPPKPRRVLYINLEIQREFFIKRINTIKEAMGIAGQPTLFSSMSLRGNCDDHSRLLPRLSEFLSDRKSNDWEAIFLDPLYKMLHGSESDQEYIAALVDSIERFGDRHNAATIYGAHYAKGDAFAKSPMDRIAGSGVIGRDADTLVMVTRMPDDPDVFVQDTIVRNFAPMPQRSLRYIYPLMSHEPGLSCQPHANGGVSVKSTAAREAKSNVPSPVVVANVLRGLGGEAPAGDRMSTALVHKVKEACWGVSQRDAITAVALAEGITIEYTGIKSNKGTYILK